MKKYLLASCVVATMSALVACSSKNDASESNFKTVLNATVGKDNSYCLWDSAAGAVGVDLSKGQGIVYLGSEKSEEKILASSPAIEVLGLWQNWGLLREKVFSKDSYGIRQTYVGADLTDVGKQYFKMKGAWPAFCFGNTEIDSITQFTPPAADLSGVTVSHVDFTGHYVNFPDVFKNIASHAEVFRKHSQAPVVGQAVLELTNNGWTVQNWQVNQAQ